MKRWWCLVLGGVGCLSWLWAETREGESASSPPIFGVLNSGVRIAGKIADGTPPPPVPEPELPEFEIEHTTVRQEGGRSIVMHRVKDPNLPERPLPVQRTEEEVDQLLASVDLEALRAEAALHRYAILSATIYDHELTFLRWTHRPDSDRPAEEYRAWSNVDFCHLSGFGSLEVDEFTYSFLMAFSNIDTKRTSEFTGKPYEMPDHPVMPAGGPAFVVTRGDPNNAEAIRFVKALHDLYVSDGDRLVAAYESRRQARQEREAWLRTHPPVPQDVVLYSWDTPDHDEAETEEGR